ncbi:HEAT repeat domain-containing protein [Intestinirhabdus alba]|jgi:HEAT repeat protein|nr:HEAT repeat domain-containing protein [Intestinirhabdus alba]
MSKRKPTQEEICRHAEDKKRARDELYLLLDHPRSLIRYSAACELQQRGGKETVKFAEAWCRDSRYRRRATGAFILGQITLPPEKEASVFNLLNAMAEYDKSALARAAAVEAMAHRCRITARHWPPLLAQSTFTVTDGSINVRRATAFALSAAYDERAIPLLVRLLNDTHSGVRSWAAFSINFHLYDTPEIRERLINLLHDPDDAVRAEAILGLAHRKEKSVVPALKEALRQERVFDEFIEAAGASENESLLPELRGLLRRCDDNDRLIATAIRRLQNRPAPASDNREIAHEE